LTNMRCDEVVLVSQLQTCAVSLAMVLIEIDWAPTDCPHDGHSPVVRTLDHFLNPVQAETE
jgi:hypothetical protein